MRVLVTGAFGYLGTAVVRHLASQHRVVAAGRAPRTSAARAAVPAGVEIVEADVQGLTARWLREFDAIVHLTGSRVASGGRVGVVPTAVRDVIDSTIHVAAAAREGARLVLASSIYVYGATPAPLREDERCAPDTLYGALKVVAEAVWLARGGVALRFAHVYGAVAGVGLERDGLTERLARAVARNERFQVQEGGRQIIDLVHVADACCAIERALTAVSPPLTLNIGGGVRQTVNDVVAAFAPYSGAASMFPDGAASLAASPPGRNLDCGRAAYSLGWTPRVALRQGAAELVEAFSARGVG